MSVSREYDDRILETLFKENEQLKQENAKLQASVTRLDLFNKILEREAAEIRNGTSESSHDDTSSRRSRKSFFQRTSFMYLLIIAICGGAYWMYRLATPTQNSTPKEVILYDDRDSAATVAASDASMKEVEERAGANKQELATVAVQSPTVTKTFDNPEPPLKKKSQLIVTAGSPTTIAVNTASTIGLVHYKVRSRAYFHNLPDESTRRRAFITHWNNAVITPIEEKGDFVYVIFKNHLGQTSKGWLNKDELIEIDQ